MESKNIAANNKKSSSNIWKVTKKIVSLPMSERHKNGNNTDKEFFEKLTY